MSLSFYVWLILHLSVLVTSSLIRRDVPRVIELSDGQIQVPASTSGQQTACSTITTTIGTRVDTIPVPCYDTLATPTLTEQVMIGTASAVLIVGPSGDVYIESEAVLLTHTTNHAPTTSADGSHTSSKSSSPFSLCPPTSVPGIPACWGQPQCVWNM